MSDTLFAVTMPKWGLEMAEGAISAWLVAEGDAVNAGDELVDIETSKIVNTLSCNQAGTLVRIVAQTGSVLEVGALLGVIATTDVSAEQIDQFVATFAQTDEPAAAASGAETAPLTRQQTGPAPTSQPLAAPAQTAPVTKTADTGEAIVIPASLSGAADNSNVTATPVARRLARQHGINLNGLSGTGRHGRVTLSDIKTAVTAAGGRFVLPMPKPGGAVTASKGDDSRVTATPVARRLAKQLGINLLDCRATGRHHRVSKADVETAAARFLCPRSLASV